MLAAWVFWRPPGASVVSRRRRLWIEWFATALFSSALLIGLIATGGTSRLDNTLYDVSVRLKHEPVRRDIVIVAVDPRSLAQEGQWPWPRRAEAQIIERIAEDAPRALACYFWFLFPSNANDDKAVHDAMLKTQTYVGVPRTAPSSPHGERPMTTIPIIASAAKSLGTGDAIADEDGVVRRAYLFDTKATNAASRLVLQLARLEGKGPAPAPKGHRLGAILIPFAGPPGTFSTVSAISVLNNKIPRGFFRDKFVLLGATAPGLLDNFATPMSTADGMPNVEVEANILNSLLRDSTIQPAPRWLVLLLSLVPLWVVLTALIRLGPRDNLILAAAMSSLPLGGAVLGVTAFNVWLPPAAYLVTMAIILPYWGWRRLNAASAFFAAELRTLEDTAGVAVVAHSRLAVGGGDLVLQQMTLLEETKRRISDLRRFVADMLANFPDPVLVVDRGGGILMVNQAASDFAGRIGVPAAPGNPIEPILSTLAAFGRDPRPMWPPPEQSDIFGALGSSRPITGIGPSGRAYELRFTPTVSAENTPTGWIIHLADVTPLVSAMRQREDALELLSHDMRTPLAAIMAVLHHPDFQDTPSALRQRISYQAGRTLDLADAFVRLAKAESADYALEPIDLAHALMDAADAVWPLAQAAGVRVLSDLDEDVEYVVLVDRSLLTRALINLLDNAVKYSPSGAAVTCRLTSSILDGRPAVACEIADAGMGMAQTRVATLFRKFDSDGGALNGSDGIGLGLALVHTVVKRHNGAITCDSVDGEGTVFTVTLPIHDESDADRVALALAC